ncbi:hypothetical protein [Acinetobacter seifertii]|uniref:hypothetical protein n=1 Tax=Acinetobacter seifertii TaxID=1530123 RepID=UPI003EE1F24A
MSIESLNITAKINDTEHYYVLEVRSNLVDGWLVMLTEGVTKPITLSSIELPSNCKLVEGATKGIFDISCPRNKQTVTDVMILAIQKMKDEGLEIKQIRLVEHTQDMFDFSKIVEAYNRNEDILFV